MLDSLGKATGPSQVVEVLRSGGLVALPSDTTYALVADPFSPEAVERLRSTVGLAESAPVTLMLKDPRQARAFTASLRDEAWERCKRLWPGAATVIVRGMDMELPAMGSTGFVALRVPATSPLARVVEVFGPVAVTSARSGETKLLSCDAAIDTLGELIDLYVEGSATGEASTIFDATQTPWTILRSGPCDALVNS